MNSKLDKTLQKVMAAYVGISSEPPDLPDLRDVTSRRGSRPAFAAGLAFVLVLLVVGVVASLVRSWSSDDSATDPDPGSEVELPLDWLRGLEIGQRETDLYFGYMKRCMAESGFAWEQPEPLVAPTEWAEITRYPSRYGVVTLGQAELAAYRSPEELFPGYATEEADKDSLPSDPAERAAFQAIWFGPEVEFSPDDLVEIADPVTGQSFIALERPAPLGRGCQGQANTWLYGGAPLLDDADVTSTPGVASAWVATLIRDAFEESLVVDPLVLVAAADWRVCMEAKGWQLYGTWLPGGIRRELLNPNLPEGELLTAELERLERQRADTELAIDDVGCQQDVGWFASLRTVEAERQQATVERVPGLLTEVRDLLEAYSARLDTLRLDDLGQ